METPAKQSVVRLQKLEFHSQAGSHDKSNQLATNQTASQTQLRADLEQNAAFTPQKPSNNFRSHRDNTSSLSNDVFSPGKTSNIPTRLNSTNSSLIHTVGKRNGPKFDLKHPYASPITVDDINALGYTPSLNRSKQSLKFGKLLKGLNYCSVVNSTRDLLSQRVSAGVSRSGSKGVSGNQPVESSRPETPVTRIENVFQASKLELLQMTEAVAAENKGPDMEVNYFEGSPPKKMPGCGFSRLQISTDDAIVAAANQSGHKRQASAALNIPRKRVVVIFDRVEQKLSCDQGLALIGHIEFPKVQNKSLPCTVEIMCELQHPIYVYINFNKPATKSEFVIKSHQRKLLIPQSYSHLMIAPDSIRFRIDSEFPSELLVKSSFQITPIAVTKAIEALADTFGTSAPKGPNCIISEDYVRSVTNMKIRSSRLDSARKSSKYLFDDEPSVSKQQMASGLSRGLLAVTSSGQKSHASPLNSPHKGPVIHLMGTTQTRISPFDMHPPSPAHSAAVSRANSHQKIAAPVTLDFGDQKTAPWQQISTIGKWHEAHVAALPLLTKKHRHQASAASSLELQTQIQSAHALKALRQEQRVAYLLENQDKYKKKQQEAQRVLSLVSQALLRKTAAYTWAFTIKKILTLERMSWRFARIIDKGRKKQAIDAVNKSTTGILEYCAKFKMAIKTHSKMRIVWGGLKMATVWCQESTYQKARDVASKVFQEWVRRNDLLDRFEETLLIQKRVMIKINRHMTTKKRVRDQFMKQFESKFAAIRKELNQAQALLVSTQETEIRQEVKVVFNTLFHILLRDYLIDSLWVAVIPDFVKKIVVEENSLQTTGKNAENPAEPSEQLEATKPAQPETKVTKPVKPNVKEYSYTNFSFHNIKHLRSLERAILKMPKANFILQTLRDFSLETSKHLYSANISELQNAVDKSKGKKKIAGIQAIFQDGRLTAKQRAERDAEKEIINRASQIPAIVRLRTLFQERKIFNMYLSSEFMTYLIKAVINTVS